MKNKNAKYIIEKLEQWFHDLIDCTSTFESIKERHRDSTEINYTHSEIDELMKRAINCFHHIEVLKHEIRAVLNMMEFWYGRNKNE